MIICIYVYIIISGQPISECLVKELPEALFTKSTSVDEGMIAYKGRFSFKQYLPAKPTKYGIKFFEIWDLVTCYFMRVEIYSGRDEMLSCGFTFNIVKQINLALYGI